MSHRPLLPATIARPLAAYSHGVEVQSAARLVFTSGQLAIPPSGEVPEEAGAQAEICFGNIAAILAEAGMTLADVVRINAYVTDRAHMAAYMAVRDQLFPQPAPASTLMIVSGFTRPEFKVEIEVVAAAAERRLKPARISSDPF